MVRTQTSGIPFVSMRWPAVILSFGSLGILLCYLTYNSIKIGPLVLLDFASVIVFTIGVYIGISNREVKVQAVSFISLGVGYLAFTFTSTYWRGISVVGKLILSAEVLTLAVFGPGLFAYVIGQSTRPVIFGQKAAFSRRELVVAAFIGGCIDIFVIWLIFFGYPLGVAL